MDQEAYPSNMESATPAETSAGPVSENVSFSSPAIPATTIASSTAINNRNTTLTYIRSQNRHLCGTDNCSFTSATAKGIREHLKNKHLGTECYWKGSGNEICGHTTLSHEELYDHFNQEHLRAIKHSGPPYQCPWPGNPGIPIPDGPPVPPEGRCKQTFQDLSSAFRHAREHQHKIWRAMDNVAWPAPSR